MVLEAANLCGTVPVVGIDVRARLEQVPSAVSEVLGEDDEPDAIPGPAKNCTTEDGAASGPIPTCPSAELTSPRDVGSKITDQMTAITGIASTCGMKNTSL